MNKEFMKKAITEAQKAGCDIPVGAVIVKNNKIISVSHNEKETKNDITAHAEIIALRKASEFFNNWRLDDCELYVTLEPCPMCAWTIIQSRIKAVYFGSYDNLYGAFGSKINLTEICNSKISIKGGILEEECDNILNNFFKKVRNDNRK